MRQMKMVLVAVVVWGLAGSGWGQIPFQFEDHHLFASDGTGGDYFGYSVSVSGEVAIAGAFRDATGAGPNAGTAYIYRFNGTSWLEEAFLIASDGAAFDNFGHSVSISGSPGNEVAIVGAYRTDTAGGIVNAGSAYVYRFNGKTWVEEAHLIASDGAESDTFGWSVSICGSPGNEVAIIGAFQDETTAGGMSAGSAYVYRCNGKTWVEEAHLFASDGSIADFFGYSVSISGSPGNEVAIVGARNDTTAAGSGVGSAYIYRFNGTTWIEEAHLLASDGAANDTFGWSVSISGSPGNEVAIVGAQGDSTAAGLRAGSAYLYRFNGSNWVEEAHLFASDGQGGATIFEGDRFGISVSVSNDVAIVGAYRKDTAGGSNSGSAYVYRFNGTSWVEEAHYFPSDGEHSDGFGWTVGISGNLAIVGDSWDNTSAGPAAGSVYIFEVQESPALCPGDITPSGGNGVVNIEDLVAVLNTFGPCSAPCPADITPPGGNGTVNIDDLVALLNAFGPCP